MPQTDYNKNKSHYIFESKNNNKENYDNNKSTKYNYVVNFNNYGSKTIDVSKTPKRDNSAEPKKYQNNKYDKYKISYNADYDQNRGNKTPLINKEYNINNYKTSSNTVNNNYYARRY